MNMQKTAIFLPEKWVDNYSNDLYRYSLVRVMDAGYAEDIVQETFLSAWRARETYNGLASEKNWLYAICKNKIIDHFRKQNSNSAITLSNEEQIYFDNVEHWKTGYTTPKKWQVNIEQQIDSKEFYKVLETCKNKLNSVQQSVFVMKYMEGMDSEEICTTLEITPANYWVLIHRCKLHLRSCLEKNWLKL